ncbi:hypothetical protein [Actinoplanes sp. URMC 104]|uniref:hypothetical protein n=1 Tax=Actinoplanes sp. URMC 104 TaxID=3423409 RepID=UPI003F1D2917
MVDLVIAVVAVVVLVGVAILLVRAKQVGRAGMAVALAVAVVAAGAFAVSLYRSQTGEEPDEAALPKVIGASAPARQGLGAAVLKIELPMGSGDKYPQAALWLLPPRPGTDAYTGDVSLLCATPGKTEKVQNCTGGDQRVWSAEPLAGRATIGPATGDPFADPAACDESNGVEYRTGYLQLTAGSAYCLHKTGDDNHLFALRVPSFPTGKPLPARILVELSVLEAHG